MRKKNWLIVLASVLAGGLAGYLTVRLTSDSGGQTYVYQDSDSGAVVRNVSISGEYPDFTYAAETAVKAVVYVKVVKRSEQPQGPSSLFEYFFGFGNTIPREQVGTGSGVIISEDGFIVTNNHVVSGATEVEVTVGDNKTFKADIVGTDPATDVALLKIDAKGLPVIPMGDSDQLRLGEWVLAIGSPYGLTSTITAGIVSAKGRSMPSSNRDFKIESFIQTDAAVNPGNSGGALVNIKGELVGINTAIISQTGSYAGYSFAIPVNMVKKIAADFREYGSVQRAMLGITMLNNSEDLKEEMKLSTSDGVYISEVVKGGAAEAAGVKEGDILLTIDGTKISKGTAVQELISQHSPGDKVDLEISRDGKILRLKTTLIGEETQAMNAYNQQGNVNLFGAQLVPAPRAELEKLGLKAGVKVASVDKGKVRDAGIKAGFIITYVNNNPVASPQDVAKSITNRESASLDKYLQEIGREELIGVDEEVELAQRIRKGDQAALEKLTKANLRFVVSVAKQYQNQGLSLPDLINEGNLGLIKAAEKFDETRGFKFISYAVWWIRQSILQALAEQSRIVRLPLNQVGSLNKINKVLAKFEQENERTPSPDELAEILEIPRDKIADTLRVSGRHVSVDAPFVDGEDNNLLDVLVNNDSPNADRGLVNESLNKEIERALSTLTERERDIVKDFFGIGTQEMTLEEIGEKFGLTRERVRQIKEKAIRRLRHSNRSKLLKSYLG